MGDEDILWFILVWIYFLVILGVFAAVNSSRHR
jgi:hypothetical protein